MRGLKATLALALSLAATTLGFAAGDPLMKETQGLFEPVPSEAPAFKDNPSDLAATTACLVDRPLAEGRPKRPDRIMPSPADPSRIR